jgi:hypothetical protein
MHLCARLHKSRIPQYPHGELFWRSGQNLHTAWTEAGLLVNLAIPTVLVLVGSVIPSAMTASYIGYIGRQLGPIYLDGFTLASLTGNLLTLSLLVSVGFVEQQRAYSSIHLHIPFVFHAVLRNPFLDCSPSLHKFKQAKKQSLHCQFKTINQASPTT